MAIIDGMLQELEQEAQTTRRVLERVPGDQLGWRPHKKARTLGELALHVASTPGAVATLASQSEIQAPDFRDASPTSAAELIPALDESIATAKRASASYARERRRILKSLSTTDIERIDAAIRLLLEAFTEADVAARA